MQKSLLCFAFAIFLSNSVFAQDLILSAPPRENKQAGQKLYQPLASFLTKQLGKKVKYVHPGNWLTYQNTMRDDGYDFVFDGPHFASWRVEHLRHEVMVKVPGTLQFYLIANKDDPKVKTSTDLIGRAICGISPPHLSTLAVLAHFNNPVRQPIIKGIKGGMGKVYKAFNEQKCSGAVLRTLYFKKKLTDEQKSRVKIVFTSEPLTNQVITAGKRISRADMEKIQKTLLQTKEGNTALKPILQRFNKKAKNFLKASNEDVKGVNQLLEGVIFGW